MNSSLNLVVYAALLTWVTIIIAAMLRLHGWTPQGMMLMFGNRDKLPPATPLAGRAERAAKNTLANFALFAALVIVAEMIAINVRLVGTGAMLFFWARVVYVPVYLIGIPYLRTLVWLVGTIGLGMIAAATLCPRI
jgi:uncharacterized MAPEG superfamily protein